MKKGEWVKFSNGTGGSNCVEVMLGMTGVVYVRNSRNIKRAPIPFTSDEWSSFVEGVKQGVFDL